MSRLSRFVLSIVMSSALLTAGCGGPSEVELAADEPTSGPCCSVADVISMSQAGVDDDLIIASIRTTSRPIEPTAQDLIALNEAGVSKPVQAAVIGTPVDAATPVVASPPERAPSEVKPPPAKPAGPPPLPFLVAYTPGDKVFTLTNTGGSTLTGLVLTANGEYVYALPVPLPPGNPDRIRIGSFTSPKTGHKLYPTEGLKTLRVKADQGTWHKTF